MVLDNRASVNCHYSRVPSLALLASDFYLYGLKSIFFKERQSHWQSIWASGRMKKETREEDGKKKLEIATISLRYRGNERNTSDNQIRMNNIRVLMHVCTLLYLKMVCPWSSASNFNWHTDPVIKWTDHKNRMQCSVQSAREKKNPTGLSVHSPVPEYEQKQKWI